ncbi:MAG TPA: hypothetical protein PK405_06005 [Hyphomicrobiales bacterium]|nr:hypothetical protein [Rhodobiaceae bacterium]HXK54220.1 hypothetical protein [Hyphomicrobiales bacterium]
MARYLLITAIVIFGLGPGQPDASATGGGKAAGEDGAHPAGWLLAQGNDAVKECRKACAAKYRCNRIIGTPGLPNPDLIACKEDLQACQKACKE